MANDVSLIPFELVKGNWDNIHEAKEAYLTKRQHTTAFGFKSKRQERWLFPHITLYKYFVFYHLYLYFITFKFYPTKENPLVLTASVPYTIMLQTLPTQIVTVSKNHGL